jgi:formylglycine-generating enzyme required for sulfatase activity
MSRKPESSVQNPKSTLHAVALRSAVAAVSLLACLSARAGLEGFVRVEAGTAPGGSPTITEDFYIGTYEATNQQVADAMQWAYDQGNLITASGSTVRNAQGDEQELLDLDPSYCQISFSGGTFSVDSGKGNYPCVAVTWYGAAATCNYLSQSQGRTPAYNLSTWELVGGANGYRLPSDAQWEYAARGGKDGNDTEYSGSDTIGDVAWYRDNSDAPGNSEFWNDGGVWKGTLPVGQKAANELGTFDMSGNVWEWCHDWHPDYVGVSRVFRGGSWSGSPVVCRVSYRLWTLPDDAGYVGFRLSLPVPEPAGVSLLALAFAAVSATRPRRLR